MDYVKFRKVVDKYFYKLCVMRGVWNNCYLHFWFDEHSNRV